MFLHMSASVHAGIPAPHPPGAGTPNRAGTPWSKHPLEQAPPWDQPPPSQARPQSRHPPSRQQAPPLHMFAVYYRPQRSCEGYVFTHVCLSTGGSASVHAGIPPSHPPWSRHTPWSRHPQSRHPSPWSRAPQTRHLPQTRYVPGADTPPAAGTPPLPEQTATVADGTHTTGMHSCSLMCFTGSSNFFFRFRFSVAPIIIIF